MTIRQLPDQGIEDLLQSDDGLTSTEACARLSTDGGNDIMARTSSPWRDLGRDIASDPMIWFMAGVGLLFAALGDYVEAVVLGLALIPLVGMDAYLHRRTRASTQGLSTRLAAIAQVWRDDVLIEVPARLLVPGDLARVVAGGYFPADGVIASGDNLQADESTLTGESQPVRKVAYLSDSPNKRVERSHWGFAGTRLLTGEVKLRVAFTGRNTEYGAIVQSALAGRLARTPLQTAVGNLVATLLVVAIVMCVALAGIRFIQGHGVVDAIVSAVTLAVAALPEEFPVVMTMFLGIGVFRLARRQALVRRAVAVEGIGRITTICTDKTGTLTEGKLTLEQTIPCAGLDHERLTWLAAQAANPQAGDPLDQALLQAVSRTDFFEKLATFPFTEDRRRETSIVRHADQGRLAVTKGAPETIMALCTLELTDLISWRSEVESLARSGHKVIACATRLLDVEAWVGGEPDRGFVFAGLLAFADPVRNGVPEALRLCRQAGIGVVMVTGDHPVTAGAIARKIGLGDGAPIITTAEQLGLELGRVSAAKLRGIDVVARAAPGQKLLIVRALQAEGEIVAVTGDGVNDVPALQAADIGIAMGERGTQSAREVAAIVLLDDNFRTIVHAIAEGRQLFLSLQLSFSYLLMVHVPLVVSATLIPLAGFPLLFLPVHIVWIEFIMHPTAILAFQSLPKSSSLLPIWQSGKAHFFSGRAWAGIALVGVLTTVAMLWSYRHGLGDGYTMEQARTMALTVLILASSVVTVVLSGRPNRTGLIVVGASAASLIAFAEIPRLSHLVHLASLNYRDWGFALFTGASAGVFSIAVRYALTQPDDKLGKRKPQVGRAA